MATARSISPTKRIDLYFRPYPKDMSVLSLRSPLKVTGSLGAPHAGPDKGALAGRAGLALALGAVNPLLALAATVETGPGEDANCGAILREAASPGAAARVDLLVARAAEGCRRTGRPAAKAAVWAGQQGAPRSWRRHAPARPIDLRA